MDEFGIPAACQRHDADIDRRLQMFCFVMDIDKLLLGIDRLRNKIICAAIYFFLKPFYRFIQMADVRIKCGGN